MGGLTPKIPLQDATQPCVDQKSSKMNTLFVTPTKYQNLPKSISITNNPNNNLKKFRDTQAKKISNLSNIEKNLPLLLIEYL